MKSVFQKRRGIFDAGIIFLGIIVLIIAIIGAAVAWSDVLKVTYVDLITQMPKFEYDVQGGHEMGNRNFEIYQILRNISFLVMGILILFAGLSFMFEHINFVPPDTGFRILSSSIIFVFFFFFFPMLWDLLANTVEQLAKWILNPEDPTQPAANVDYLLKCLTLGCPGTAHSDGGIQAPNITLDAIVAGISDPLGTMKNLFLTAFLATFKAIAFLIFMFFTFLIGTIRQTLTAIVIIGLPLILMFSLFPFFKRITDKFIDAMLGLLIAPIFSALVIVAGVGQLQELVSHSPDPITEWFAALAVVSLGTFMPAILIPLLGSVMSSVSSIATGAVSTGAMVTGMGAIGTVGGIGQSASQISQQVSQSGVSLARAAFSPSGITQLAKTGLSGAGHGVQTSLEMSRGFGSIGKTAKFAANAGKAAPVAGIAPSGADFGDSDSGSSEPGIFGIDTGHPVRKISYGDQIKRMDSTYADTLSTFASPTTHDMNLREAGHSIIPEKYGNDFWQTSARQFVSSKIYDKFTPTQKLGVANHMETIYSKDSYGATHAFNLDKVANTLNRKHFPGQSKSGSNSMTSRTTPTPQTTLDGFNNE